MESPYNLHVSRGETDRIDATPYEPYLCSFAVDTGNQDSGSALIEYETGMHVAYSQNFFARKGAAKRGARLLGYSGTLEFDWYTGELKVFMHHTPRVETYKVEAPGGHDGGDLALAQNFIQVMQKQVVSVAPLSAGLLSGLMCLKAQESTVTRTFQEIRFSPATSPSQGIPMHQLA